MHEGELRRHLLTAAGTELLDRGRIELGPVAARAGVDPARVRDFFGGEGGLIRAFLAGFYYRINAAVFTHIGGSTWAEREHARLAALVSHLYADPLAAPALALMRHHVEAAQAEAHFMHLVIARTERNLAGARQRGDIGPCPDPQLQATVLMGGLRAAIGCALERPRRPDPSTLADQLWAFMAATTGAYQTA